MIITKEDEITVCVARLSWGIAQAGHRILEEPVHG